MKKLNLKVGIAAFSVMLIGLVTAAVMTFNFADSENPLNLATVSDAVYADAAPTTTTMIDRIIENSLASDSEDKNYHIVEITSGSSSNFVNFMTDSGFRELIFNQHSTTGKKFATDARVTYDCYTASTVTAADVQGADLIYISEDPNKKYSKTNDIPTDLVSVLSNFAVGDYKPLIIDTTGGSNNGGNESTINYATLYRNVLKNKRRYSLEFPHTETPIKYIKNETTSLWLPIHSKDTKANWVTTDDNKKMASIVTFAEDSTVTTEFADALKGSTVAAVKVGGVDQENVYAYANLPADVKTYFYVASESDRPDYVRFETKTYNAKVAEDELAKYDLIIFDDSCKNKAIDKDTYLAIRSFELSKGHIVYDTELIVNSSNSSSISTDIDTTAQNYKTILSKVSQAGKPAYSNIFVTNRGEFNTLITNVIPDAYDNNIVYIINNGSFRGLGGTGDASNKFTLLEIEPEYPIDPILETKFYNFRSQNYAADALGDGQYYYGHKDGFKGYYYLNTLNILNGVTQDEISFDGTTSMSDNLDETYVTTTKNGKLIGTTWVPLTGHVQLENMRVKIIKGVYRYCRDDDGNIYNNTGSNNNGSEGKVVTILENYWYDYNPGVVEVQVEQPLYEQVDVTEKQVTDNLTLTTNSNLINYYSWKWSRAKLAYVTGKSYDEVEVVHMSSAEFNASLDSLNDTYDMIYIGGDNSAIKPVYYWYTMITQTPANRWGNEGDALKYKTYAEFFKDWPAYNMYYMVGDVYKTAFSLSDNTGNSINQNSYAADSGNDLTEKRTSDLNAFANAGRPVIIGKDLYEAVTFDLSSPLNCKANLASMRVLDNKVDPRSNIYGLVRAWVDNPKSNVVLNFDFDDTIRIDNNDKAYGNTVSSFVTVFRNTLAVSGTTIVDVNKDDTEDNDVYHYGTKNKVSDSTIKNGDLTNGNDVFRTFQNSGKRPKFIVESAPVLYSTGEFLPTHTLRFKVKLSNTSPDSKARIYIDNNGDGKFTSDEKISKSDVQLTKGSSVTVSADLKSDFSGPVFWKLEVYNVNNEKDSASVTGVSAVKTGKKQPISILQILPTEAKSKPSGSPDSHIFLCKDCQESLQILTGGRLMGTNAYNHAMFHGDGAREFIYNQQQATDDNTIGSPGFTGENKTPTIEEPVAESGYGFNFDAYMTNHDGHGNSTYDQVGVHEHQFGFAAIQDSAVEGQSYYVDNWNLNLFDNASDMYEIRLTCLTISEFNELATNIPTYLNKASIDDYSNLADKYYRYFTTMSDLLDGEAASKYESNVTEILDTYDEFKKSLVSASNIKNCRDNLKKNVEDLSNDYTNGVKYFTNDKGSPTQAEYKEILDNIIKHNVYGDLYFYNTGSYYNNNKIGTYKTINENFVVWRNAKVLEQYFYQKYIYYQILASGGKLRETITPANADSGKKGAFGLVVLGAAEKFANSQDQINDAATKLIVDYMTASSSSSVDEPGHIILFHNTLNENNATTNFSKTLRPLLGMNTSNERLSKANTVASQANKISSIAPIELTDVYGNYHYDKNTGSYVQKYGISVFMKNSGTGGVDVSNPDFDALSFYSGGRKGDVQTDYAQCSSTTKGIMTSFPNAISNKIKIAGTHQQTYTLDLTNPNVTVWYSLAGGTQGTDSNMLVADLNDHANNYYLYTNNNVTFFGAGHMFHTGLNKLNSEESKLIINAVLNAARPSAVSDDTKFELVTHKNKNYPLTPVSDESTEYKMYQYEATYSPDKLVDFEFGIDASSDLSKGITIKYLDIFFDLDYDPAVAYDHTYNGDKDISVYGNEFDKNGNRRTDVTTPFNVKGKTQNLVHTSGDGQYLDANGNLHNFIDEILNSTDDILYIDSTAFNGIFKNLTLRDEYFVYGSGDYTYLSVVITDSKGNQVTKTIKIKKAPFLFDIT